MDLCELENGSCGVRSSDSGGLCDCASGAGGSFASADPFTGGRDRDFWKNAVGAQYFSGSLAPLYLLCNAGNFKRLFLLFR